MEIHQWTVFTGFIMWLKGEQEATLNIYRCNRSEQMDVSSHHVKTFALFMHRVLHVAEMIASCKRV